MDSLRILLLPPAASFIASFNTSVLRQLQGNKQHDDCAEDEYRQVLASFSSSVGHSKVDEIAGHMARDLGLVQQRREVPGLLGEAHTVLVAVVEAAMKAWLQMKGSSSSYKMGVSGARWGKGECREDVVQVWQ
jgi:hypothetical protein